MTMTELAVVAGDVPKECWGTLAFTSLTKTIFSFGHTLKRLEICSAIDISLFFELCQRSELYGVVPACPQLQYLEIQGPFRGDPVLDKIEYAAFFDSVARSLRHMPRIESLDVMFTDPESWQYLIRFGVEANHADVNCNCSVLHVARYLLTEKNVQPWINHVQLRGVDKLMMFRYMQVDAMHDLYEDDDSVLTPWNGESIQAQMDADEGRFIYNDESSELEWEEDDVGTTWWPEDEDELGI